MATFINTNNEDIQVRWYAVEGDDIEPISRGINTLVKLKPYGVKFTFKNEELDDIHINGRVLKGNGALSERVMSITSLHYYNRKDWPKWLKDLYSQCLTDRLNEALAHDDQVVVSHELGRSLA